MSLCPAGQLPFVSQLHPNRMNFRECYDVE